MFERTRLTLTAWYLLILMAVMGLFSLAFYQSSTRELQRLINRIELEGNTGGPPPSPLMGQAGGRLRAFASLEELNALKQRSLFGLLLINATILILAGGASYFLAGITLKPIKTMIDEQNEFISNASHELKTPIAVLRAEMEASLLEKKLDDKQARKLIKSNLEELHTLQKLASSLLQISTQPTLQQVATPAPTDLSHVITQAVRQVTVLAKKKKITFSLKLTEVMVQGNFDELVKVMIILLDNAIKYSHGPGKIKINLNTIGNRATVTIQDEGVGISESDQGHIFQRFFRGTSSHQSEPGFGLGLSIAETIVHRHRGTISVASTIDHGSTFTVTLPASK